MSSPAYYMPSLPSNRAQRRAPAYPRLTSAPRRDMPQVKRPNMTSLTRPDTKSATSLPSLTYLPSYMSSLYQSSKANALHRAPSGYRHQAHAPSAQLYQANNTNKEYAPPRMAYVHDGSPYVGGSSYVGGSPYIATNGLPYIANNGLPYIANNGLPLAAGAPHVANLPLTDNALQPTSFIVTRRPQYPRSEGYYSDEEEEAPLSGEEGSPASSSSGEVFSSPASSSEEFFSASEDEEGAYSSASPPASNHVSLNDTALIPSPDDHLIAFGDDYLSLTEDDANILTKDSDDRYPPGDERDNSEDGHSSSDESTDSEESADPSEELVDPDEERRRKRGMKRLAIIAEYARQAREEMRYEEAAARGSRVVPAMCAGRAPSAKNLPKAEVRTAMVAFIASRGEGRAVSGGAGAEEKPERANTNSDATFSYSRFAQLHAQRARLDYLQRARAAPHEQHKASHAEYVQRHAYLAQLAHLEARSLPHPASRRHPAHPDAAYVSPRDLALQGPPPVSRAQIEWEVREGGPGAEAYRTAMWVQYQQARAREAMPVGA